MSINSQQDDKYFRTSSFYTACFLYSKGFELTNVDKLTDPRRAHFVFINLPELELVLHSFNFAKEDSSEVMTDCRKFITAIKHLKNALYQESF